MGGEWLFKLSNFSYCNSVISTFNLNVLFHSIMGLSTLNVVHLTYSTNASLLKNFNFFFGGGGGGGVLLWHHYENILVERL